MYEATKVANFAASSLLEGIRISADAELSTLEQVRRRYKQ
ncbi:YhfG family protein [Pantoea agglomerans]|nr:YhfG family protein [Pantoea agglomerans]